MVRVVKRASELPTHPKVVRLESHLLVDTEYHSLLRLGKSDMANRGGEYNAQILNVEKAKSNMCCSMIMEESIHLQLVIPLNLT